MPAGAVRLPTDQYEQLAGMDIATMEDQIPVTLRPREGAALDMDAVRSCVEYTVQQAGSEA